jgi:hypothetical protein
MFDGMVKNRFHGPAHSIFPPARDKEGPVPARGAGPKEVQDYTPSMALS